jgi:putative flippase GtrA
MPAGGTSPRLGRELAWFTVVGAVGFLVDAAVFLLLSASYGWAIAAARALSASLSIVTTWALNRKITFAHGASAARGLELLRYTLVQGGGLLVNLGVFAIVLWLVPALRPVPIVALAIGAAGALLFNFVSARTLVFRGSAPH